MSRYRPFEFLGVDDLACAVIQVLATVGVVAPSADDQVPLALLLMSMTHTSQLHIITAHVILIIICIKSLWHVLFVLNVEI